MSRLTGPQKLKMEAAGTKFACHVEAEAGEQPDGCVLDYGCPADCDHAWRHTGWTRKTRESCRFWLPVQPTGHKGDE